MEVTPAAEEFVSAFTAAVMDTAPAAPAPPEATEGEAANGGAAEAEPVAWRYRHREPKWLLTDDREYAEWIATHVDSAAEPLYLHPAPPAPDQEAVEELREAARGMLVVDSDSAKGAEARNRLRRALSRLEGGGR
jgi:hypothetical protein